MYSVMHSTCDLRSFYGEDSVTMKWEVSVSANEIRDRITKRLT